MKKKKTARKKKKEENDRNILKNLNSEVVRLEFLEEENEESSLKRNNAKKQNLKNYVLDMVETDLFIPLLSDIGECDYNDVEDESIEDEVLKKNGRSKEKDSKIGDLDNNEMSSEKNSNSNIQETNKKKNFNRKSLSVKFLTNDFDDGNDHRENGTYVRATGDSLLNSISSEGTVNGHALAQDDDDKEIVEEVLVEVDPGSLTKSVEEEAREIITELKTAGILQFFPTSFLFSMTK